MPVSKTDFIRALQCEKMLWLDAHAPEFKIIPPEVQARLNEGNDFGDEAMGVFGDFVETTTLREDGRLHFSAMIEKTKTLLENGENVICEASFSWYGNFCAVDLLKKEGKGYRLYEVKNAFSARKEFITDLSFQRFLLKKCGLNIVGCSLILRGDLPTNLPTNLPTDPSTNPLANSPANLPATTDVSKENSMKDAYQICDEPFETEEFIECNGRVYRIVDVTKNTKAEEKIVEKNIFPFGKLKRRDAIMPNILPSPHCEKPYRCWYYDFCHKTQKNALDGNSNLVK